MEACLSPLVHFTDLPGRRALRSVESYRLLVPLFKLSTVAAAHLWNGPPDSVMSARSLSAFQNNWSWLFQRSLSDIILWHFTNPHNGPTVARLLRPLQILLIDWLIVIELVIKRLHVWLTIIIIFWPTSTKPQAWILRKSYNGCNGCSFGRHGVLKRDRIPLLESYRQALLLMLFVTRKIPPRRPQMRRPAVRKCSCLYTMYHLSNNGPKGRETTVKHFQRSGQAIPHRMSGYSEASISVACACCTWCNLFPQLCYKEVNISHMYSVLKVFLCAVQRFIR